MAQTHFIFKYLTLGWSAYLLTHILWSCLFIVHVYLLLYMLLHPGSPSQTGTGTLMVSLMDVNDNYPEFAADYRPVIYENQSPGLVVVTVSAEDNDTALNGPPFEFWLPQCSGPCPCSANPSCADFSFKFIPGLWTVYNNNYNERFKLRRKMSKQTKRRR